MGRNDKLYEESRLIRKAVNEGKTTKEIMKMLSLSSNQIRYRIETRYSVGIANSILKNLDLNDGKTTKGTEICKKISTNSKSLVVDTCALHKKGAFEFIMSYSTVILLTETVKELDQCKKSLGIFGQNIRKLLSESAKDTEGKKIKIVLPEMVSSSVDEMLLNFCKGKDVVLYTGDNALATLARGYGIEYIIAEDFLQIDNVKKNEPEENIDMVETVEVSESTKPEMQIETQITKSEIKVEPVNPEIKASEQLTETVKDTTIFEVDVKKLAQDIQCSSITKSKMEVTKTTIDNVSIVGKNLVLKIPQTTRIGYVVLSDDKIKKPVVSNMIYLETGNIVLVMTYKLKHKGLCISTYEITDIQSENHSLYLGSAKINHADQIQSLDFPKEAKREISNYFALVRNSKI